MLKRKRDILEPLIRSGAYEGEGGENYERHSWYKVLIEIRWEEVLPRL